MKMENDRIKKMGKVTKKMMLNWQVISNKSRTSVVITAAIATTVFITMFNNDANADIAKDLGSFYERQGFSVNATRAHAYRGQSAGYFYGGRLVARAESRNMQPLNVQAPYIRSDCDGIDAFLGSIQFIEMKQLVDMLKSIGKGATGYAFNLAMQTMVPQIYNTIQKLSDIAREINNFNVNSCEAAAQLVGGVWPQSAKSSAYLCNRMGTSGGLFEDAAKARQKCGIEGERSATNKNKGAREKAGFEDELGDSFNLVWRAIRKKDNGGQLDADIAEMFMSISGTIVMKPEGSGQVKSNDKNRGGAGENVRLQPQTYSSLAIESSLIDGFMFGKKAVVGGNKDKESDDDQGVGDDGHKVEAMVYYCSDSQDEDKCLEVKKKKYVPNDDGWVDKIHGMLDNIKKNIKNRTALTENEKALIERTSIPILKIIAVEVGYKKGGMINISEFAEAISYDLVLRYMEEVIDYVNGRLSELEKVQVSGAHIESLKRDLREVIKRLVDKRNKLYQQMRNVMDTVKKAGEIEKRFRHSFSTKIGQEK
jgi:conjugative transfer pilus assembly protein TraH